MLHINNPEAYEAIIEGYRGDHGQRRVDASSEAQPNPTVRRPRMRLLHRLSPLAAG